jgi:c(7)-type cytochrome triheme protein
MGVGAIVALSLFAHQLRAQDAAPAPPLSATEPQTQTESEPPAPAAPLTDAPEAEPPAEAPPAEPPAPAVLEDLPVEQEPQQPIAFNYLPKAKMGYVDWVEAIKQGIIEPKESLDPNTVTMRPLDFDIIFKVKGDLPDVVYPHYPHTIWLDCRNCHPGIFLMKQGSNPVTMEKILQGEFCGRCHGTVAFPISDCFRCHSRPK